MPIKSNNTVIINNKKDVHIQESKENKLQEKLNVAANSQLIKVNGSKKNWSKSDYYIDMLSKED